MLKAFRKRIITMLVSLKSREALGNGPGELLPFAPTDEEVAEVWERFASKDHHVLDVLLQILTLVRYPVRYPAAREGEGEPFSAAITVLLKVIFNSPSSLETIEQALHALKLQFSSELDGFLQCAEQHAGFTAQAIIKANPNFIRRALVFYGFVIAHLHDEAKLLALLGPNFPRVKTNTADNTVLTTLLVHGLQSPHTDIRGKAIELIGRLCLSSEKSSTRCLPLFERALSKDLEPLRVVALKIICDLCFFYPPLNDVELTFSYDQESEPSPMCFTVLVLELLSAPSKEMQLIATIAIARMLHHSRYAEPEKLLLALADKYVTPYSLSADSMSLEEHQQMMEIIYVFFQKYADRKEAHQPEVANTVVLLVIEALEGQVIPPAIYSINPDDQLFAYADVELPPTAAFLGFKRKAKFLLSFLDPALVPTIVESIQYNVATSMQAEMSAEEAMTILGLEL